MKKPFLFFLSIVSISILLVIDKADRNGIFSHQPTFENEDMALFNDNEVAIEDFYARFFGETKYRFPRRKTSYVKLYKNKWLLSRLTSKTANPNSSDDLIKFFNNPVNFSWNETTWSVDESEYILRFFDSQDNQIGKVFLCLKDCKMTKSLPFSPNMKFGGLSDIGMNKIQRLISQIESE
ncbi:hypothetical protein ACFQ1M_18395 [Sungkyunkwania multivorans]|uniref:Uncharacterized protein n=1 Tax=Sungkyunkwania multivorans TaxID=1173618 RepID=A0ABW3D3X4_9FLAO